MREVFQVRVVENLQLCDIGLRWQDCQELLEGLYNPKMVGFLRGGVQGEGGVPGEP